MTMSQVDECSVMKPHHHAMFQDQFHHILLKLSQERLTGMLHEWDGELKNSSHVIQQYHIFLWLQTHQYRTCLSHNTIELDLAKIAVRQMTRCLAMLQVSDLLYQYLFVCLALNGMPTQKGQVVPTAGGWSRLRWLTMSTSIGNNYMFSSLKHN